MFRHTVGIILVSEAVLAGSRNADGVHQFLHMSGWQVKKLSVLPCNENLIYFEIDLMYKLYDAVIVLIQCESGVNVYKILANLFHEEMAKNRIDDDEANTICVPKAAKRIGTAEYGEGKDAVVHLQRVFVLNESDSAVDLLKSYLMDTKFPRNFKKEILLIPNGNSIEDVLKQTNSEIAVHLDKLEKYFKLTISSDDFQLLIKCDKTLKEKFASQIVGNYPMDFDIFASVFYRVDSCLQSALNTIKDSLSQYGPENIFLSFNGGKDCTVLLVLTLAVLRKFYPDFNQPVVCWYARSVDAFPEQDCFISHCKQYYNLDVITDTSNIKNALAAILEKKPHLKACLMGTRRTDPYSGTLSSFQMTDPDWPQIMRILPLLDWHYSYIWDFLLHFQIPYCSLYDQGYTSLGNVKNTVRNPSLLTYDIVEGKEVYLPAYKLLDAREERCGRQ